MENLNAFVLYHGCASGFLDGTRQIVENHCRNPTQNSFWKNPEHTTNIVAKSTRTQLKQKPTPDRLYFKRYVKDHILKTVRPLQIKKLILHNLIATETSMSSSSSESSASSDTDSCYYSDDSVPETNYYKMSSLTGENLVIDIKPEPDNTNKTPEPEPNEQKPELKTNEQNPDNK